MTTIHMDIDAARGVQNQLEKLHGSIQRIVQSTNATISGLPPHWRSHSADQFYGEYHECMGEISGMLGRLTEIAAALASEIDSYERMAEKFGD
jgi:uncharacterized protein YukE